MPRTFRHHIIEKPNSSCPLLAAQKGRQAFSFASHMGMGLHLAALTKAYSPGLQTTLIFDIGRPFYGQLTLLKQGIR